MNSHMNPLLNEIPMPKKGRIPPPPLDREGKQATREMLKDAIKKKIQTWRSDESLPKADSQSLDMDLEGLKSRYKQWCGIEDTIAPRHSEMKDDLDQLEIATDRILKIIGKPSTFISALLMNN